MPSRVAPRKQRPGELLFFLVVEGYLVYNLATASDRPPWRWIVSIVLLALGALVIGQWIHEWRGRKLRQMKIDGFS
jgi:hypothetical protein